MTITKTKKIDPFKPSEGLLVKLASAIVHAEEFMSPDGHPYDKNAFDSVLNDGELKAWMGRMNQLGLLPLKRKNTP